MVIVQPFVGVVVHIVLKLLLSRGLEVLELLVLVL